MSETGRAPAKAAQPLSQPAPSQRDKARAKGALKASSRNASPAKPDPAASTRKRPGAVSGRAEKQSGVSAKPSKKAQGKATPKTGGQPAGANYNPLAAERIAGILETLARTYPNAECALLHKNPWELLVATILSAQCTDARVNMVTPGLFKQFPTPADFATASLPAIEEQIRSTGFYHNKAKSISGAAKRVVGEFDGKVPRTMSELLSLPGVARKTANVVLGVAFHRADGVVVDTHVLRLSRRLELTQQTAPERVEQDLMKIIPQERWIAFSHELIHHGRQICIARKPRCMDCTLEKLCHSSDKTWSTV